VRTSEKDPTPLRLSPDPETLNGNLAVQDAVSTANLVGPRLRAGILHVRDLAEILAGLMQHVAPLRDFRARILAFGGIAHERLRVEGPSIRSP
jgi:hypothetical protein